jgi:hypothetical protein
MPNSASFTNSGSISTALYLPAVYPPSGGSVTNLAGASISSPFPGVQISRLCGNNSVFGGSQPGTVTNDANAFISGVVFGGPGTLNNSGTITAPRFDPTDEASRPQNGPAPGRAAAEFFSGGSVTNNAGGSISGNTSSLVMLDARPRERRVKLGLLRFGAPVRSFIDCCANPV